MTGKERILCAMNGERPDRTPWAPNLQQWFYVHRFRGTLPEPIRGCRSPIEALRFLGADVITRWDGQIKGRGFPGEHTRFKTCRLVVEHEGDPLRHPVVTAFNLFTQATILRRRLETPHGTLTQAWAFETAAAADFEVEHWWKNFAREYDAVRAFVEDRHYDCDAPGVREALEAVGEDGIILQEIPENPLKMLYWLAGPENAIYWLADHNAQLRELFAIHTRRTLEFVEMLLDRTDARFFISNDNLDTRLFPPAFFDRYLFEHYRAVADLVHGRGGWLWVHSCGETRALAGRIAGCGIDCLEGLTPPPPGDLPLHEAHELIGPQFLVEGGDTHLQQEAAGDEGPAIIREYVQELFRSMRGNARFIFASSCNTSPLTPWRNLLALRDAARAECGTG